MSYEDMMKYYKNLNVKTNFLEPLAKYNPEALKGFMDMRASVENGALPEKYKELLLCVLASIDNEVSGAKSHAIAAIDSGLKLEELVQAFIIVTIAKGINTLCMAGVKAIEAAEERYKNINSSENAITTDEEDI